MTKADEMRKMAAQNKKTKTEKTKRLAERQVFSSRFAPNCQFLI